MTIFPFFLFFRATAKKEKFLISKYCISYNTATIYKQRIAIFDDFCACIYEQNKFSQKQWILLRDKGMAGSWCRTDVIFV